ncbi:hypothetical protein CHS0354_032901 [Potamilus streckersoni]|uniref:NACHT domain-containing protein n=1 Tax=Potamilus streckersoni TaxID=2493646 RepID=A0AAE0VJR5_9BIVA|nr:hypothetical protein CHS0354_032901 [Potamilus streckersoni]
MKKKMRLGGELLPPKNPFSCVAVCSILLFVSRSRGESSETVCEFHDANLLFPNTPASSSGDIKAKTWNKENGIRVASWMENTNFEPNKLYEDRLMAIGENSIKIRNATRSDSGTYTLVLTSGLTQKFLEYTIHLEVLVPPTYKCIPNITLEGNAFMVKLPPDVCGIPMLTPQWSKGNINFESRPLPGMYTACAFGESKICFKGNADKLCSNYTVSEIQTWNESSSVHDSSISAAIIFPILIVIVITGLVLWKRELVRKKFRCLSPEDEIVQHNPDERNALMVVEVLATASEEAKMRLSNLNEEETFPKGVQAIKRHLINQYRTMTAVSLSPCYEENLVDVSEVYCDLDIISLGEDVEGIEYINPTVATYKEILCGEDKNVATTDSICPIPAMILGECGSGKSSWCKNVVSKWCQYHDNNEMNLKESDLGVPELARFDILLYIALENKGEGLSFLEYVRNTFFYKGSDYFEKIISCSSQHRVSILLLIDGFDEVTCDLEASLNLLRENKQCSIVVTSRSSHLDCLQLKPLRLFQIQGMSPSRSKEYTKKVLDILSERRVEKLNVDLFWKFAKHIQVLHMCHLPFQCLSLIMFWIESKALSVDLTDVLLTVIEYYLRRAMTRKKFKANICQILEQQHFDISIFIAKTKHKQYLRDHGYLLKVISSIAEKLWYLQMQVGTDENSAENEPNTKDSGIDVKLCVETGILKKSFREKMGKKNPHITFSHPMLFDFFVASSIALEKRDLCTKYMTTTKAVVENSYMIHMLCQLAPNTGQEVIKGISKLKLFDENNKNDMDTERMLTNQKIICNIQCKDPLLQGGAPVRWLQTLIYTDELSSEKLSILTEGLKFTKELTVFLLQLYENRNECIFRLPILPKLQAFLVDIENCTLLLHEEREWSKEIFSELHKFVLKSVKIDVKTTGYIVEALGSSRDLRTLELCPKDDTEEPSLCDQKTSLSWGCLSKGITCMTKLRIVRLHNLRIGKHLSTLIDSLCRCLMLEILDLLNLKEVETEQIPSINTSDRRFCECMHHKKEQLGEFKSSKKSSIPKTVQLTKNAMSGKSWLTLSNHLGTLSPSILYIDQVHQSGMVLHELFQGIGRCKNLTILSICCISAGNDLVDFSSLRALQKLKKLTLCKITLPDSSWTELYKVIGKLTKLKEISLAHLEMKTCFIKVQKLSKLMLLEMREIELEETSWTKLADKIISLPKLKKLQLISCKMSRKGYSHFFDTMKHSSLHMDSTQAFNIGEGGMLSLDMVVTSD